LAHEDAGSCELTQEEDVKLFLNGDSQVFHGILQQVNEPICDDFLPEDQILHSTLFHEKEMVAMFNDPEHHKLEHRVVMDVVKPQDHMFFQDPFVELLDSFNGGVCYVMSIWSQELMKLVVTDLKIDSAAQGRKEGFGSHWHHIGFRGPCGWSLLVV
jgi:hypothetical protein